MLEQKFFFLKLAVACACMMSGSFPLTELRTEKRIVAEQNVSIHLEKNKMEGLFLQSGAADGCCWPE